jgi:HSP20 family molecular chaperone IbpA
MNISHPNYGQNYRLMRAALQMEDFTVSELQSLTGANENTVYSFISGLEQGDGACLESTNLPTEGRGRPKKRYTLTEEGLAYATKRVAQMAFQFGPETSVDVDLIPVAATMVAGAWAPTLPLMYAPPVNVYEYGEHGQNLLVQAEIPGVVKEDLDVHIVDNRLIISGRRKKPLNLGRARRIEVRPGVFKRAFILPSTVIPKSLRTEFKNGVLKVLLDQSIKAQVEKAPIHRHESAAKTGELKSAIAHVAAHKTLKASSS